MPLEDAMAEALGTVNPGANGHAPASEPLRASDERVREPTPSLRTRDYLASAGLTRREQEVTALLARGLTNRQIAAELTIAERTAETHVCKILSKLNLTRRAQVTAWAMQHDLRAVPQS